MRRKKINAFITLLLFFAIISAACATQTAKTQRSVYAQKVNWHFLKEGTEQAKALKKPMLVDFAVPTSCPRCEFLKKNVYSRDEIVAKINNDFIPIWIDLSGKLSPEEKAMGEKFDFRNDCLLLFLDYEGAVIQDPAGKKFCFVKEVPPEVIIQYLDYIKAKYSPFKSP